MCIYSTNLLLIPLSLPIVQVNTIEADQNTLLSGKEAINLFEAAKVATENGPVNSYWDEDLINKVIHILQSHPVSQELLLYMFCRHTLR
jgi:hypothetical protein